MDKARADRLRVVATEMDAIVREIGPKWIRLAHLRQEAHQIIAELEKDQKEPEGEGR